MSPVLPFSFSFGREGHKNVDEPIMSELLGKEG
jgi:hypothetical protein